QDERVERQEDGDAGGAGQGGPKRDTDPGTDRRRPSRPIWRQNLRETDQRSDERGGVFRRDAQSEAQRGSRRPDRVSAIDRAYEKAPGDDREEGHADVE